MLSRIKLKNVNGSVNNLRSEDVYTKKIWSNLMFETKFNNLYYNVLWQYWNGDEFHTQIRLCSSQLYRGSSPYWILTTKYCDAVNLFWRISNMPISRNCHCDKNRSTCKNIIIYFDFCLPCDGPFALQLHQHCKEWHCPYIDYIVSHLYATSQHFQPFKCNLYKP